MNNLTVRLQKMNLANLRVLGKLVGLSCPTALSKNDLITAIVAVADGLADADRSISLDAYRDSLPPGDNTLDEELLSVLAIVRASVAKNRPFRQNISAKNLLRLNRSDDPFAIFIADSLERIRSGYIFKTDEGSHFLFDISYSPVLSLPIESLEWSELRDGSYCAIRQKGLRYEILSIDGTAAEYYAYPALWRPLKNSPGANFFFCADGVRFEAGAAYTAAASADLCNFDPGDIHSNYAVFYLNFGTKPDNFATSFPVFSIRDEKEYEKVRFISSLSQRLAERGMHVVVFASGLKDNEQSALLSENFYPVVGVGTLNGSITLVAKK